MDYCPDLQAVSYRSLAAASKDAWDLQLVPDPDHPGLFLVNMQQGRINAVQPVVQSTLCSAAALSQARKVFQTRIWDWSAPPVGLVAVDPGRRSAAVLRENAQAQRAELTQSVRLEHFNEKSVRSLFDSGMREVLAEFGSRLRAFRKEPGAWVAMGLLADVAQGLPEGLSQARQLAKSTNTDPTRLLATMAPWFSPGVQAAVAKQPNKSAFEVFFTEHLREMLRQG